MITKSKMFGISKTDLIGYYIKLRYTMGQIGEIYNCHEKTIRNRLLEYNIPIRNSSDYRTSDLNFDFFSEPNLINSYWAGFIAADGCIINRNKTQRILSIDLKHTDKIILDKFKEDLQYTGKIYTQDRKEKGVFCQIQVSSKKLCDDLESNFNITNRKSLTLQPPNLDRDLSYQFLVGLIDGDGCITKHQSKYLHFNLCGSLDMMNWAREICNGVEPLNTKVRPKKSIYNFQINGEKAYNILTTISKKSHFKLDRKWSKLKEFDYAGE